MYYIIFNTMYWYWLCTTLETDLAQGGEHRGRGTVQSRRLSLSLPSTFKEDSPFFIIQAKSDCTQYSHSLSPSEGGRDSRPGTCWCCLSAGRCRTAWPLSQSPCRWRHWRWPEGWRLLHYRVLHYIVLQFIVLHYIVLHYIVTWPEGWGQPHLPSWLQQDFVRLRSWRDSSEVDRRGTRWGRQFPSLHTSCCHWLLLFVIVIVIVCCSC